MQTALMLAWRNLCASPTRTLLSILALLFGAMVTVALSLFTASVRSGIITEELEGLMGGMVALFDPIGAFSGIMMMSVSAFLIFNTFTMSITQRRQSIGMLRSLGTTRRQVLYILFLEALMIGLAGLIPGILLGAPFGRLIIAGFKQLAGGMLAFADAQPAPWSIVLAFFGGLALTFFAMLYPALRAVRIQPLEALRLPEAEGMQPVRRGWMVVILILLIVLWLYLLIAPPAAWVMYPLDGTLAALLTVAWVGGLTLLLPAIINAAGRWLERRTSSSTGRLIADNLRRGRMRVTLTILTLAFGLLIITGMTGFMIFIFDGLLLPSLSGGIERQGMFATRLDFAKGWEKIIALNLDSILLTDEEVAAINTAVDDQATLISNYFTVVPELSFFGDSFFSYMMDIQAIRASGDAMMVFREGNIASATPIMEAGCGVLIAPLVAAKNNVKLYDSFEVTGANGKVTCTVAGIIQGNAGALIISTAAKDAFNPGNPIMVVVMPDAGVDVEAVYQALLAVQKKFPYVTTLKITLLADLQQEASQYILVMLNGVLLLTVLAAALGVVNTTMMSISERRRELGLLRATGATRTQVRNIVVGEAAVMGLIGGAFGFIAGIGFVALFILTYGGNSWGIEVNLGQAVLHAIQPSLIIGITGLIAAPIIAGLAAWLPLRALLKEAPVVILADRTG